MSESQVLLSDEAPIHELDELRTLIAEGHEKGSLRIEQITACLEEVEVTKEQVHELHTHLVEQGIDILDAKGKPVTNEGGRLEAAAEARKSEGEAPKKAEIDLTVEPSLD